MTGILFDASCAVANPAVASNRSKAISACCMHSLPTANPQARLTSTAHDDADQDTRSHVWRSGMSTPMRRIRSACCALAAMGQVAVTQLKTRKKVRRFTAVRQHVARKQERTDYQVSISCGARLCAVIGWSGGRQFPRAANGFTTAVLPSPTDIQEGSLGNGQTVPEAVVSNHSEGRRYSITWRSEERR